MKNFYDKINFKTHTISIFTILTLLNISSMVWADSFPQLKGCWQCQEDGLESTLEFKSRKQLLYNGQTASYQLAPGVLLVQEENSLANYFFKLEGDFLLIISADGSVTQCQRAKRPKQARSPKKSKKGTSATTPPQSHDQYWPPPYVRPQGRIDEYNPSAQALLYKFAGRWDHVTSNTLTNLFLKPDGTYEEAYEAGHSGIFKDQGGHQTGNWGATGAQQGRGRWKVVGGLRQGKLYLVDQSGRESVYDYQVHIKGGEVFWGEYFFNGKFYSVKYIYR